MCPGEEVQGLKVLYPKAEFEVKLQYEAETNFDMSRQ